MYSFGASLSFLCSVVWVLLWCWWSELHGISIWRSGDCPQKEVPLFLFGWWQEGSPQLISLLQFQHALGQQQLPPIMVSTSLWFLIFRDLLSVTCKWCQFMLSELLSLNYRVVFTQSQDICEWCQFIFLIVDLELSCCVRRNCRECQTVCPSFCFNYWHGGSTAHGYGSKFDICP